MADPPSPRQVASNLNGAGQVRSGGTQALQYPRASPAMGRDASAVLGGHIKAGDRRERSNCATEHHHLVVASHETPLPSPHTCPPPRRRRCYCRCRCHCCFCRRNFPDVLGGDHYTTAGSDLVGAGHRPIRMPRAAAHMRMLAKGSPPFGFPPLRLAWCSC